MTELQIKLLNHIAYHEYTQSNGAKPEKADEALTYLWVDDIADSLKITIPQAKGVISKAKQAGLVEMVKPYVYDGEKQEGEIWLTEKGFNVWKENDFGKQTNN